MGNKRRSAGGRKPAPAPAVAVAASGFDEAAAAVREECEKALTAVRRGNHARALRIARDAATRHGGSYGGAPALAHRAYAAVLARVSAILDDPAAKQRHLKLAIAAARRAAELSPSSAELALFHASLLYESAAAGDNHAYEETIAECERGMNIPKPSDPVADSLSPPDASVSVEERNAQLIQELRNLTQKANFSSLSTWMKNLGGGDDKFRLIPVRRFIEEPSELRLIPPPPPPPRRNNEIKRATKSAEDRRKEIEVRVAAARLLQQQQQDSVASDESAGMNGESLSVSPNSGPRPVRKVGVRRLAIASDRLDQVRTYWNFLSYKKRVGFLRASVAEMMAFYSKEKDSVAIVDVLLEALTFAKENGGRWKFWLCPRCGERFVELGKYLKHVNGKHVGSLSRKLRSVVPLEVESELIDMIVDGSWKPIDTIMALKMFEENMRVLKDDDYLEVGHQGCMSSDCSIEKDLPEKLANSDSLASPHEENWKEEHKWSNGFSPERREAGGTFAFDGNWPISNDTERSKLLERIHNAYRILAKNKCLCMSNLSKVLQFATDELKGLQSGHHLMSHGLEGSPLCICFLDAHQLRKVLKFLQDLLQTCELGKFSERDHADGDFDVAKSNALEALALEFDSSLLVIDGRSFGGKSPNDSSPDMDALFSWLYAGPPNGDQLALWSRIRDENSDEGIETSELLEKEFSALQNLCQQKLEHLGYEEGLLAVESLCMAVQQQKCEGGNLLPHTCVEALKKRQEELSEQDCEEVFASARPELEVISSILKEAQAMSLSQLEYDEALSGVTSRFCDLESGEEDDWRMLEYIHPNNNFVPVAISKQKEQLSIEFTKIDTRIMRKLAEMQRLEQKLGACSLLDYRTILIPLMKSFLRNRLEEMVDQDAREKSEAAQQAFLAELAMDAKYSIKAADVKQAHDKTKKKTKEFKRNHDGKDVLNDSLDAADNETQQSDNIADVENLDNKHLMMDHDDEVRIRVLEAEERKLEETLEYQSKFEPTYLQGIELGDFHFSEGCALGDFTSVYREKHGKASDNEVQSRMTYKDDGITKIKYKQAISKFACGSISSLDQQTAEHDRKWSTGWRALDGDKYVHRVAVQHTTCSAVSQQSCHASANAVENAVCGNLANGVKPLRHMSAEDAEEAEIQQAVIESLGNDVYGTGLKNAVGEYNCFLNVIIQSLWHLRAFRGQFLKTSSHMHIGDPCAVCALYEILIEMSKSSGGQKEAVSPNSLRIALSKSYPDKKCLQEGQMNDAAEVLGVIFECLHKSCTDHSGDNGPSLDSWDCGNKSCVTHSLFGMDIQQQMNCQSCGMESRRFKYTTLFHNINASSLRTAKNSCPDTTFDQLLLIVATDQIACDQDTGGCGKSNQLHHILSRAPQVFTLVLGWQNAWESVDDIVATVACIGTEVDISTLYRGLDGRAKYSLVSVVCYYGQHYHCFAIEDDGWVMYDDQTIKVVGSWDDVLIMCERGHLQPQVLFFEAVN